MLCSWKLLGEAPEELLVGILVMVDFRFLVNVKRRWDEEDVGDDELGFVEDV